MAENETKIIEYRIDNIGIPQWQTGLARAVNETYSYAQNSLALGLAPAYMKDYYWRYIRPCLNWLDGYVYSLHNDGSSGIVSTRIGKALITGLTKQIVGEKLLLKVNEDDKNEFTHKTIKKVGKWMVYADIIKPVYAGVGFANACGTSLIKVNKTLYGDFWWEAVRFDNCVYKTDFRGEIDDATFLIRGYTDTREGQSNEQFFLTEHRFYKVYTEGEIFEKMDGTFEVLHKKGERVAMVEYKVQRVKGTLSNNANVPNIKESQICKWQELPQWLRTNIKKDYSALVLDTPQQLGFRNLGVEALCNGYQDLGIPNAPHLGEGLLISVQADMITYEIAASYKIRDMYLGKGSVYQPKSASLDDFSQGTPLGFNQGVLTGVGDSKVELLKGLDPETQKVIVEQFQIRGEEWQKIMDDCIRNIATKWGMSPKVLSSYLANGTAQMTATQVDSEDDISIAFIYHTRSYYKGAINRLLETTLNAMGLACNVSIDFASPSLINKDRIIDRQLKLLEAGLIDIDDAVREIFPDLDEEQIECKVKIAKENREKIKQEQITEFDKFGGFEDYNDNDLGGKNLKGSTDPIQ